MQHAAKSGCRRALLRLLVLFVFWTSCQAALANRSIDDIYGDSVTGFKPIYNPATGHWKDQTCTNCEIQPNSSYAYDWTWSAGTYKPSMQNTSITLQFTGVAVWVFFILSNANKHGSNVTTNTHCNFTLDGSQAGSFVYKSDLNTFDFVYNATVFSATGLSNGAHQLIIMTNDYPYDSYINFDYAIYTAITADPSTNSPDTHTVAIAVGTALGSLAGIIIAGLLFFRFRTKKSKKRSMSILPAPFESPKISLTQLYPEDNETGLASQGPDFSEYIEPFRNSSPGTAVGAHMSSQSRSASDIADTRGNGHAQLPLNTNSRDQLRAVRQMEIDQQLQSVQSEMESLTANQNLVPSPNMAERPTETEQEMEGLREQVRSLRGQIHHLERERESDRAMGLSNDPPPAYT